MTANTDSAQVTESRMAALRVAQEVARGLRLDVSFSRVAARLASRDRAFVHELVYGVSRLRGRLDHLLARRVDRGLERLDPGVHEILRLGAYQVLYMKGVPRYAAVSQAVAQARGLAGARAAGLVNAVLRGVADDGDSLELFPDPEVDVAGFLSTWGSHPAWLVERWLERWTPEEVHALVDADNSRPGLFLLPLEAKPEEAVEVLEAAGLGAEAVGQGTACVRLAAGVDPATAVEILPSVIQDPGASLVVGYADPDPGMEVADLCAAPGGKALALSCRASYTVAADRSEVRMRIVRDNVARTGRKLGLVVADARRPPLRGMSMVVVDVPCTGTGTLRRHPDGRWRIGPASIREMARLQRDILDSCAGLVPPGGLLVYSTCSLEPEENEEQVDAFLRRHAEFHMQATETVPEEYLDDQGRLRVLPQRSGFDGAFAARLRRVG
jgi:16S rRNA (cytosine967-C5)-methyltransferase